MKLQGETEPYAIPCWVQGLASAWLCRISAEPWRWPFAGSHLSQRAVLHRLNDLPELDGRYAVFGRVIEGWMVDQLRQGDRLIKAEIIQP